MSIAADDGNSSSDSGQDSPRTPSSLSTTWRTSGSSWPDQGEFKPLWGADPPAGLGPRSCPSSCEPGGLRRSASLASVDSMASTFLPSISPDSTRSPSTTRIGTWYEGSAWGEQRDFTQGAGNSLSVPLSHLSFLTFPFFSPILFLPHFPPFLLVTYVAIWCVE